MNTSKSTLILLILAVVAICSIQCSTAHFTGYSSVDNMEIRYIGTSSYSSVQDHSIDTWNELGEVNIAPDTLWTIADLKFEDMSNSATTTTGRYTWNAIGIDYIKYNTYWFNQMTDSQRKKVGLHEMGHALGLDHSYYPNVMVQGAYSFTSLGTHDIEDYNTLYS
jgi:hypothetical protein